MTRIKYQYLVQGPGSRSGVVIVCVVTTHDVSWYQCTDAATGQQLPGNLIMLRRRWSGMSEPPPCTPAAAPKQILYSNLFPGSVTALSQKTDRKHPDTHTPATGHQALLPRLRTIVGNMGSSLHCATTTVLHCSLTAVPCNTQFAYHSLECFVM